MIHRATLVVAALATLAMTPSGAPAPATAPGAQPVELEIEFIGNMAVRISDGDTALLSDFPYRSGAFGYMEYEIADPGRLAGAVTLISHEHADHWAPELLDRYDVRVLAPPAIARGLASSRVVPWSDRIEVGAVTVIPVRTPHTPAHHSYRVEWGGRRLYFTGDTESTEALLAQRDLDVAFVSPWLLRTLQQDGARIDAELVIVYHHRDGETAPVVQEQWQPRPGERLRIGGDGALPPPLVLVSMDGFRWDYLDLYPTPNLDRVIAAGTRAEGLIPVFPSKTFPSHYSIVTGLYPGHHGIISNNMRDPRWPESFGQRARAEIENGRWWGGEPIWVTAQRQGMRTAVYFWPGSEAPVAGVRPDHWRRFDGSVPFEARIEQVLQWLALPSAERPRFIAVYANEPNDAGHTFGPLAAETRAAVAGVDTVIGQLLDGLEEHGGLERVNLVLVADHGMAQNARERVIVFDDYVQLLPGELFDQGALVQIFPRPGRETLIYEALKDAHPALSVYRPGEIPEHFHLYDHPRLPPILGTTDPGWVAVSRALIERVGGRVLQGDHGQDPRHPDMHGLFVAAGPAFAVGARVGRIEAVDVYALLAKALGIEPAAHDGDMQRAAGILRRADVVGASSVDQRPELRP